MRRKKKTDVQIDWLPLLYTFLAVFAAVMIVFRKDNPITIFRTTLGLFWLFILPGYALLFTYKINFIEKIIAGTALAIAASGVLSYYLTIFGVNINMQFIVVPLITLGSAAAIFFLKKS